MAELADAPDLGSGGNPVQVQVLLSAYIRDFKAPDLEISYFYGAAACRFR